MKKYYYLPVILFLLIFSCFQYQGSTAKAAEKFVVKKKVLVTYTGNKKSITLPKGITSIGDNAFQRNKKITSVTIPDGVTSIGTRAFQNCKKLKKVILPNSIKKIKPYAFQNCNRLQDIRLPKKLTTD